MAGRTCMLNVALGGDCDGVCRCKGDTHLIADPAPDVKCERAEGADHFGDADKMVADHDRVWLEPARDNYGPEGRLWCQDPVWDDGVEYVRAAALATMQRERDEAEFDPVALVAEKGGR